MSVLWLACQDFEPSQRELSGFLGLDPSQVVSLIDDLQGRGLVERKPDKRDNRRDTGRPVAARGAARGASRRRCRLREPDRRRTARSRPGIRPASRRPDITPIAMTSLTAKTSSTPSRPARARAAAYPPSRVKPASIVCRPATVRPHSARSARKPARRSREVRMSGHAAQFAAVLDALDAQVAPPVTLADTRQTMEFVAALYASAFTGERVHRGQIGPDTAFAVRMSGTGTPWETVPTR
jgi:hypothetical protein